MKIAVPVTDGKLCSHFGHCESFTFFDVAEDTRQVAGTTTLKAPEHVPGLLPKWIQEQGAAIVLAGGMGARARALLEQAGIRVITGVESAPAAEVVNSYLNNDLKTGSNVCDH